MAPDSGCDYFVTKPIVYHVSDLIMDAERKVWRHVVCGCWGGMPGRSCLRITERIWRVSRGPRGRMFHLNTLIARGSGTLHSPKRPIFQLMGYASIGDE